MGTARTPKLKQEALAISEHAPRSQLTLDYYPVSVLAAKFGVTSQELFLLAQERSIRVWGDLKLQKNVTNEEAAAVLKMYYPATKTFIPGRGLKFSFKKNNYKLTLTPGKAIREIKAQVTEGFLDFISKEGERLKKILSTPGACFDKSQREQIKVWSDTRYVFSLSVGGLIAGWLPLKQPCDQVEASAREVEQRLKEWTHVHSLENPLPLKFFANAENHLFIQKKDMELLQSHFKEVEKKRDAGTCEIYAKAGKHILNYYGEELLLTKEQASILNFINKHPGCSYKELKLKFHLTCEPGRIFHDKFKSFKEKNKKKKTKIDDIIKREKSNNSDSDRYYIRKR